MTRTTHTTRTTRPTSRTALVLAAGALAAAPVLAGLGLAPAEAAPARTFANCTAMNKVWPHGVGRPGAVDSTSGTRVTTYKRSRPLYLANQGSDRDGDGIACEKV